MKTISLFDAMRLATSLFTAVNYNIIENGDDMYLINLKTGERRKISEL